MSALLAACADALGKPVKVGAGGSEVYGHTLVISIGTVSFGFAIPEGHVCPATKDEVLLSALREIDRAGSMLNDDALILRRVLAAWPPEVALRQVLGRLVALLKAPVTAAYEEKVVPGAGPYFFRVGVGPWSVALPVWNFAQATDRQRLGIALGFYFRQGVAPDPFLEDAALCLIHDPESASALPPPPAEGPHADRAP